MKFIIHKTPNLKSAMSTMFEEIKKTSGNICLLVPDKLTVTAEKKLFEYLNIESCFNINITTLTRLSQQVLADLNVEYKPITKIGSIVLLKKILKSTKELRLFNSPSFSYNYTDLLFRTLTQFKASNISPGDMVVDTKKSEQLKNKIADLKIIYEKYENGKAGLVDPSDRLSMFARYIKDSQYIKNTTFFLLGFDDFTNQGYILIEQLIKHSLSVNIAVYTPTGDNKNIYSAEMFDRLSAIAYNQGLPLDIKQAKYIDDELHTALSNNLFGFSASKINCNNISIKNFKNINEEIEFIARDIRQNILNGHHYYEYGVACFDLETHKTAIKNSLEKYDINFYIDSAKSLQSTFYFKFFVNYLKLFAHNKLSNLIEFINSPFLNIDKFQCNKLVNFLHEISFSGNLDKLTVDDSLVDTKNFLQNILNSFPIKQGDKIADILVWFENIKSGLNLDEKLNQIINHTASLYDKKILTQSPVQLKMLFEQIEEFFPDADLEEIIDILESSAKDTKIMPIPLSLDCVQVCDASEIMSDFDNLYMLNTNNSTAPAIIQDIGIILDKDINNLDFKNKLSPTISHLNKLAKFKLFNSSLMFNKNLVITSSLYNDSETSPMVTSLQNLCKNNICENVEISSHKILSKWDMIEFLSGTKYSQFDNLCEIYGIKKYQPIDQLPSNLVCQDFQEISCSALENYFKCPKMYFLNYTLKIKPERQQGIAMVDIGNMLHKLAEDFYKAKKPSNISSFVENQINQYMHEDLKLKSFISTPIYHNLIKEGKRFLNHLVYLDDNCMFVPAFYEYSFGLKSNKTIPLADNVYLKGKIDRIDFFQDYVRIIDYKTGNADATLDELYYGKKLQLFLYGELVEQIFLKKLAGTFYLPVKNSINLDSTIKPYKLNGFYLADNSILKAWAKRIATNTKSDLMNLTINKNGEIRIDSRSTKILSPNNLNNLLKYSLNVSKNAIEEIKSGYIATSPIKFSELSNSCDYCPYLAICRKNSMNINMRNKKKINLTSFGGENG